MTRAMTTSTRREHLARVADGLMPAELDHAGAEILRVAAELAHGRLERHARAVFDC